MEEANPASLSPILAGLFPQGVVAAELREPADAALLLPEERQSCSGFGSKRLEEFAAGRVCARRALAELGIIGFPLPADDDRRPCWPRDVAGSITHTTGFCGAVVAGRDLRRSGDDGGLRGTRGTRGRKSGLGLESIPRFPVIRGQPASLISQPRS